MTEFLHQLLGGQGPIIPFIALIVLGGLVFLTASRLAHDADAIAHETGWGGLWIGSLLLAAATSLPELFTDINAVLQNVPDIGAGDLFGSSIANMTILATVNLIFLRRHLFKNASSDHALVGLIAILLTVVAAIGILTGGVGSLGPIGFESALIVILYVGGLRLLWRRSAAKAATGPEKPPANKARLRRAWMGFGGATLVLLLIAPALVAAAEIFATESGLSTTFVGTLIVGLTTSFPEMSAVYAAVRMGSYDLAVGDILGSNAFNMTIFFFMDLFYIEGPVFSTFSQDHLITALFAIVTMAIGTFALLYRSPRQEGPVFLESFLILIAYFSCILLLSTWGLRP